ncbi:MAG: HD domain-containing protein [Negativicutes bacterium]|nr:HD domain-containing protein [Negativicutes bacterium]
MNEQDFSSRFFVNEHCSILGAAIDITVQECLWVLLERLARERRNHLVRCQLFGEMMLEAIQRQGKYRKMISEEYKAMALAAIPLHDIGKVLVSEAILFKQEKLTESEYQVAKEHVCLGRDLIKKVAGNIGDSELSKVIEDVVAYHHERWDGRGYPEGLAGEDIPLAARLMAIIDTYDSMTARRGPADVFAHEEAVTIIETAAGALFDPEMVRTFAALSGHFREISIQYAD